MSCQDHTGGIEPSFRVQCPLQSPTACPTVDILLSAAVVRFKAGLLLTMQNQWVSLMNISSCHMLRFVLKPCGDR